MPSKYMNIVCEIGPLLDPWPIKMIILQKTALKLDKKEASSKFGSALIEFISETLRNRGMPLIYTTRSSVLNKYKAKNIKFWQ